MRQLIGARIELAVAQALRPRTPPPPHRACWRPARRTAPAGWRTRIARAVSFQPCRMVWRSSAARTSRLPIARSGSATAASSSRTSRPAITSTLPRSNRSVAYSSTPCDPRRRAVGAALLGQRHRQVELRAGGRHRLKARAQPGKSEAHRRVVLQRQHHLEQRMPRQRARRVEHLNQPLERQILVAVGRQIGRPHPRDQLAEARIARRVGAQHQAC